MITPDGSLVMGSWNGDIFTWTEEDGVDTFPSLIGSWEGIPTGISDDGIVVGFDVFMTARRAWIWFGDTPTDLRGYLILNGAKGVPPTLYVAQAISRNGRYIIGHGFPDTAWRATIHPDEDLDGDGVVGFQDLVALLALWGPCADPCPADLNGDGDVGFSDLTQLLAAWDV